MTRTAPAPIPAPAAPALPLLVVCLASFSSLAAMRACDPLLPVLADEFGTTTGAAAQTISAFTLAYGLTQFLYGPVSDRLGRTRVMAFACLACALANLAVAAAQGLGAATAARVLAGAASGGIVPISLALIGDAVAYERRQETLARLMLATNLGMMSGQWLGGMLADAVGWRAVFVCLSVAFAAVSVPLFADARRRRAASVAAPAPAPAPGGVLAGFAEVLRDPWARWILVITLLEGALVFSSMAFVPSFLHDTYGLSPGQAGAVMALYAGAGLVYTPLARPIIRRLGERGQALAGAFTIALGTTLLAASTSWGWAVPGCFLTGLGFFMLHSTLQTHATQMAPTRRATGVSLFVVCLFTGQAGGVALAAHAVDLASARWVFALTALALPLVGLAFRHGLATRAPRHGG